MLLRSLLASLVLVLCCHHLLVSCQQVSVETLVFGDHSAGTTLSLVLRNGDSALAQRTTLSLTLPDSAYNLQVRAALASSPSKGEKVARASEDEEDAHRAFSQAVARGKMAVLADVSTTCDKCVDVDINIPARNQLTLKIIYNETLTEPVVCVPDLRLNIPSGSAIARNTASFSVRVSGNIRQPNMEAEICDVGKQSDTCSCMSSSVKPVETRSSASIDWTPSLNEASSGLRVCTNFQWLVTDPVSILAPGSSATTSPPGQYVVFLLDTGDTIKDADLRKIKDIFVNETKNLKATDSFSVVNYAGKADVWDDASGEILSSVRENVEAAVRHVESMTKHPGSSLVAGLSRALELVAESKTRDEVCSDRASVVLLTGWAPTGGDADVRRTVRWLTRLNGQLPHAALYVVAVGDVAHTCALQELAAANGGRATQLRTLQPPPSVVSESRKPPQRPAPVPQYVEPTIYNLTVYTRVEMRYAITVITSKVYNGANYPQEVVFSSVLPDKAFVSSFTIEEEGKVYESEVIARGSKPSTPIAGNHSAKVDTSARDSSVILISLNMAARGEVIFTLTYEQLLEKEDGFYTVRLNVDPRQVVENLLVAVRIKDITPITSLKFLRPTGTSTNEVDFGMYLPRTAFAINWQPEPWEQDLMLRESSRQLVVRFELDQSVQQQILVTQDGYFVHFFSPVGLTPVRKHVVFTLDVSGSMAGRKIEQLKEAFSVILDDLLPTDTFSLVQFESSVMAWAGGNRCKDHTNNILVASLNNVADAKSCVEAMIAGGSTNLIDALDQSIASGQVQQALGAEGIVIALTDGQPDGGRDKTLRHFRGRSLGGVVLFCLALGDDADFPLLQELSSMTGAFARKIYVAKDTVSQLRNFYRAIASVVLSSIKFSYDGVQETTETDFRAYVNGTEIVVAGKLSDKEQNLQAIFNSRQGSDLFGLGKPKIVKADFENLDRLRAFLKVKQLMEKDKATALYTALKNKFLTPLTSLVVNKPGGSSTLDATPVKFVEPSGQPPPPQPKLCDGYDATQPSPEVVDVPFHGGYSLSDLTWPWQHLPVLSLTMSDSNVAHGPCWTSQLVAGHCRHLIHCVLPDFLDNSTRFEADRCGLINGFVGVCCPDSLVPMMLPQ